MISVCRVLKVVEGPETHQLESQNGNMRSFSSTIPNDVIITVMVQIV